LIKGRDPAGNAIEYLRVVLFAGSNPTD